MLVKNKTRALRRAQKSRMKAKAKRVYYFLTPEKAAKYADHLANCSADCCGNQRRYVGRSLSELRFMQKEE